MRHSLLLAIALAACTPIHGTAYLAHYDVAERKVLVHALDAARELHYSVVAVESPDVHHNALLAFADHSSAAAPTALLIQVATEHSSACAPQQSMRQPGVVAPCSEPTPGTRVAVTPLAFRGGHEVPAPAQTKADAEKLMLAIFDRSRDYREPRRFF